MRIPRMAIAVSAAALAFAGLTACGGDEEKSNVGTDAKALADETMSLLADVEDFKMVGGGTDEDKTSMEMDLCIRKGADAKGTMKMDGAPVEIIKVGSDMFMKADAAAWTKIFGGEGSSEMAKLVAGKYMKTSATEEDEEGGGLDTITDFFGDSTDGVTKGDVVKIDGKSLIPLSKEQKDGKDTTTLYVPEKGKPYPVLVKVEGESNMSMKLSRGKSKCDPVAPPADQVVDADALSAAG